MKKYTALALAVLATLSVAACVGKGKAPPPPVAAPAAIVTKG